MTAQDANKMAPPIIERLDALQGYVMNQVTGSLEAMKARGERLPQAVTLSGADWDALVAELTDHPASDVSEVKVMGVRIMRFPAAKRETLGESNE